MFRATVIRNTTRNIRAYSTDSTNLLKTPLYDLHVELNATMVPFAGYSMPVLYKGQSHIESHRWTRTNVGLFDVSHMLQHKLSGAGSTEFLQTLCPTDFTKLAPYQSTLSVLLNKDGGVVDDTMITKHGDESYYIVTNAGCRANDIKFIKESLGEFKDGEHDIQHNTFEGSLLAIQGPKAQEVVSKFTNDNLGSLYFGNSRYIGLEGFGSSEKFHIARGGYTGEDGFEISIPDDKVALDFTKALLEQELVKPIGLAARDSLRLEAGMCLYGHELNEQITPIEASLNWLVSKSRRTPEAATFNGASKILSQLADPKSVGFKRVGIKSKGPSPREQNKIFDINEPTKQIGTVCSGSPSPSAGGNVGQAFINKPYNKTGTKILVEIRGKLREAEVAKMPLVQPSYYRG
ncbi:unnamed protein product [Ambrosiozyma monospora]|uniref:Aminomethyltransferase n=1 Tax=Ambrosiozyma monospora TaxID=43982 RepID=A0A9W6YWL0_AMBMO|nr:unnamed protein product [Ambrosiozyma monospora]